MKIETASMLSYESRKWKYAYAWKRKLQVKLARQVEIGSMLNNGNIKLQLYLNMKIETASMLNYENRNCKYA